MLYFSFLFHLTTLRYKHVLKVRRFALHVRSFKLSCWILRILQCIPAETYERVCSGRETKEKGPRR